MKKVLLSMMIVLSVFILTGCTNKDTKVLNNILENLTNLNSYKQLKEYATLTEKVDKNTLSISVKNDSIDSTYNYILKDDFISFETKKDDDMYGALLYFYIAEAIAKYNNMDSDLMGQYVKVVIEDNLNNDNIKYVQTGDIITYSITTKKFDLEPLLNETKITDSSLADFSKFDDSYTSSAGSRGYFIYYVGGNKDDSTIILAERNGFSKNAYDSLIALVKCFFSEKLANEFISKYNKLEEKTFDKFKVEFLNKEHEDIIDHFSDLGNAEYKFVKVKYNK